MCLLNCNFQNKNKLKSKSEYWNREKIFSKNNFFCKKFNKNLDVHAGSYTELIKVLKNIKSFE